MRRESVPLTFIVFAAMSMTKGKLTCILLSFTKLSFEITFFHYDEMRVGSSILGVYFKM
jgi:hypothetical protein